MHAARTCEFVRIRASGLFVDLYGQQTLFDEPRVGHFLERNLPVVAVLDRFPRVLHGTQDNQHFAAIETPNVRKVYDLHRLDERVSFQPALCCAVDVLRSVAGVFHHLIPRILPQSGEWNCRRKTASASTELWEGAPPFFRGAVRAERRGE